MKIRGVYYGPDAKNKDGERETPHLTGKVFFEIRCSVCHHGLCKDVIVAKSPRRRQNLVFIAPCPRCLEAAQEHRQVEVLPMRELPHDYEELENQE